jgi:YihY family inner membrane protein
VGRSAEAVDAFQRRHRWVGLPLATFYKYNDDRGGYLAALITYYGFLSLFPLLLLLTTILNFVLSGDAHLQQRVLNSALGQFPIVGTQLRDPNGVSGSGVGLAIGIVGTLYGGLGIGQAFQYAMNTIWRVPNNSRPNFVKGRARSLLLLVVGGLLIAGTTILSGLGSSSTSFGATLGIGIKVVLTIAALVVNAAVFMLAFRVGTARELRTRDIAPGAIGAAVTWQLLQSFGTLYVGHVVKHTSLTNSVFALVLGLIAWIYLEALVVVMAAEYNAVRVLRLYPRSLTAPFTDDVDLTAGDRRAYTDQAKAERRKSFQEIDVRFHESP